MKFNATLVLLILTGNLLGQNCVPQAEIGYKEVDDLVQESENYSKNGDYLKQKKYATKAVLLSQKLEKKYNCYNPKAYWALSDACSDNGDYPGALKYAKDAYQFCENFKIDNCDCKSTSQMKIGSALLAMDNDSLAIIEFKKALQLCQKDGDKSQEAIILLSLGDLEKNNNKFDEAINNYKKAIEIIHVFGDQYIFSQFILGRCYFSHGSILLELGHCDDALSKLLSALQLSSAVYDRKTMANCYIKIARIYDINAKYSESINYYFEAIKISKQMNFQTITVDCYNYLANINTSQGNNKEAAINASYAYQEAKKIKYKKGVVDAYNVDAWNNEELFKDSSQVVIDILTQAKSALANAKDIKYYVGIADAYNNIETYYENKREYKLAKKYAKLALNLADSIGYSLVSADALNDLADIYLHEKKIDSAMIYYNLALVKSLDGSHKTCGVYKEGIVDSYIGLGNTYYRKHQKDKAYENYYHAIETAKEISYRDGICIAENGIRIINGLQPLNCKTKNSK